MSSPSENKRSVCYGKFCPSRHKMVVRKGDCWCVPPGKSNHINSWLLAGDTPFEVSGSMTSDHEPLPIMPVPGVPGGTLQNVVGRPVPSGNFGPLPGGTNTRVPAGYAHSMAAQTYRGHGPNGMRVDPVVAYSTVRDPGTMAYVNQIEQIAAMDPRNPYVARSNAPPMTAGATRTYGTPTLSPVERSYVYSGGENAPLPNGANYVSQFNPRGL